MIRYFNSYVLFPILEKMSKRQIVSKYRELKKFNSLPISEQNRIQRNELHRTLLFCKDRIPYYQDLFKKVSFDVDLVLKDPRHIQELPLLTKEIVREHTDRIRLPGAIHGRKTGGSTGQSVYFYYDDEGLDWTAAVNLIAYDMAGNFPHKKDCHISSELNLGKAPLKYRVMDSLKLFSQNRNRLMIHSFSNHDLEKTFNDLKKIRPFLLQGHPSSGYAIADYIKNQKIKPKKYCDVFEPSGETLTPKMVETMETYLGCKVVNRYGNAEFGVMAHTRPQDPYNKLLIFNRAFYAEETDKGNLIFSNLTNLSMPLLRYDTGDVGTVKNEEDGSFIYDIQGRIHDLVKINQEDFTTHYIMDYLDHKIRRIREFQILIQDGVLPVINIVPESVEDQPRIEKALKDKWPLGISVQFIDYEQLKKVGWQQKFRHVIDLRGKV